MAAQEEPPELVEARRRLATYSAQAGVEEPPGEAILHGKDSSITSISTHELPELQHSLSRAHSFANCIALQSCLKPGTHLCVEADMCRRGSIPGQQLMMSPI